MSTWKSTPGNRRWATALYWKYTTYTNKVKIKPPSQVYLNNIAIRDVSTCQEVVIPTLKYFQDIMYNTRDWCHSEIFRTWDNSEYSLLDGRPCGAQTSWGDLAIYPSFLTDVSIEKVTRSFRSRNRNIDNVHIYSELWNTAIPFKCPAHVEQRCNPFFHAFFLLPASSILLNSHQWTVRARGGRRVFCQKLFSLRFLHKIK